MTNRETIELLKKSLEDPYSSKISTCVEIPDEATNGDILIALFPTLNILQLQCGVLLETNSNNWWNAPYREE